MMTAPIDELTPCDQLTHIKIVDCDTHMTEPHDLWTSRAPAKYAERVPRVVDVDGTPTWVFDGKVIAPASAASVIRADGAKTLGVYHRAMSVEDAFPNHDVAARLDLMDRIGVWAHLIYPNIVGFGGERFGNSADEDLRLLCAKIYNDAMAEIQEKSGGRLIPMAYVPWWNIPAAVDELQRIKSMGLKGVNTTADPQDKGLPDLNDRCWDPLWEASSDLDLPVNFHVANSDTVMGWAKSATWPSFDNYDRLAIASSVMFLSNARVVANLTFSGVFDRYSNLKIVSVESGIGWIPFLLQALDYQLREAAPATMDRLSMLPSDYFRRNMYSTFWFEADGDGPWDAVATIEAVGVDNCLFATDFPHVTCYYPDGIHRTANALREADEELRAKVLHSNAAKLYSLDFE
jgi:uncharacterized protein